MEWSRATSGGSLKIRFKTVGICTTVGGMIPLRDNIPSRTIPFVNYLLIAISALVFFAQLTEAQGDASLIEQYGMIPARVMEPDRRIEVIDEERVRTPVGVMARQVRRPAAGAAVPAIFTLLTCIFLHGGWMHFLGNMWFLFIFGDNVEDRFGHFGYLLFYLLCGVVASIAHLMSGPGSTVPTIGASGAIAAVMGAYFLLYPRAKVMTLIPIVFFFHVIVMPAPLFLGIWFLIQFFQGAFALSGPQAAGVAWWAHIGGFVAGLAAAAWLLARRKLRPRVETIRPGTERVQMYRLRRPGGPLQ